MLSATRAFSLLSDPDQLIASAISASAGTVEMTWTSSGIAFRRDIYLSTRQVYPALQDKERSTRTPRCRRDC
ncbi:hypothetical protein AAFF_G00440780 [Aldrovandia affinis]|uniref:Uncharacterized protein n=1 Tax=Aldrovandia affinis TaxID=143900 RepID=A0AAD7WIG9_9TELE|nr:hypothetical protein AAFF_G00440780 [Aldrovandia affinis]